VQPVGRKSSGKKKKNATGQGAGEVCFPSGIGERWGKKLPPRHSFLVKTTGGNRNDLLRSGGQEEKGHTFLSGKGNKFHFEGRGG